MSELMDWKLVPVEPTREMRKAGQGPWATGDKEEAVRATYRAMLAVSPAAPPMADVDVRAALESFLLLDTVSKRSKSSDTVFVDVRDWEAFCAHARAALAAPAWFCAARKQSLPEPADCDWPLCGCDPQAQKVIDALDECGFLLKPLRPSPAAPMADVELRAALERIERRANDMGGQTPAQRCARIAEIARAALARPADAVAVEREECAKVADNYAERWAKWQAKYAADDGEEDTVERCELRKFSGMEVAQAIRARAASRTVKPRAAS